MFLSTILKFCNDEKEVDDILNESYMNAKYQLTSPSLFLINTSGKIHKDISNGNLNIIRLLELDAKSKYYQKCRNLLPQFSSLNHR